MRGQVQPPGEAEAPSGEAAGRGGGLLGEGEEEQGRHREAQATGKLELRKLYNIWNIFTNGLLKDY